MPLNLVRRFAAATNLLVCGQRFLVIPAIPGTDSAPSFDRDEAGALCDLLRALGAFPEVVASPDSLPPDSAWRFGSLDLSVFAAVLDLSGHVDSAPGTVLVSRRGDGRVIVVDPAGAPLESPHEVGQAAPTSASAHNGLPRRDPGDRAQESAPTASTGPASRRIAWARTHMPITVAAVQALATRGLLKGRRIGVSLVLEPKTAVLALLLAEAGAEVFVFGHASETRDDVADVLRAAGVTVFADSTADPAQEEALARQFLAQGLHLLLDDGSHLIRMAHDPGRAPGALDHMIGCAEETTSGLRPLRTPASANGPRDDRGQVGAEEASGRADGFGQGEPPVRGLRQRTPVRPAIPVMASNDARSKTLFDNAYGTGQSCLMTALDLLDPDHSDRALARSGLVGTRVLVLGYGEVGRGFARLVRGLGGEVDVAEIDPVRLLQARMDGCGTGALGHEGALALAPGAHWIVSATGEPHTVTADLLTAARDGAVCFVIGGVDQEIAVDQAVARGATWQTDPRRAVEHLRVPDRAGGPGPLVTILDRGGCLNCTAGEGNPIEIMDLSFAVQVAALEHLLLGEGALAPGIHLLPKEADDAVAAAAISLASASPALAPVTVKLVEKALKDESQQMNDESQTTDDKH